MQTLLPILYYLILALVRCILLLPLFWISRKKWIPENFNCIFLFFGIAVLDQVTLESLQNIHFNDLHYNWLGKSAEIVLGLLFVYTAGILTKKEIGFTANMQHLKKVAGIIIVALSVGLVIQYYASGVKKVDGIETFLFQITLPGIAEELIYRGILLGLLNKAYNGQLVIWQTPIGWGAILTSVLFALVHAFTFYSHGFDFNALYFINTFAIGLLIAYIKEKSQSLLPGIVYHNFLNLIVTYV